MNQKAAYLHHFSNIFSKSEENISKMIPKTYILINFFKNEIKLKME